MSTRERLLWTAIKRALMLIVGAIDEYIKETPAAAGK